MKMKILILLTIIPFLAACNLNSQKGGSNDGPKGTKGPVKDGVVVEGVINGGGGKGVLCTKDGVSKLEVLDIYEGRRLYDQTYEKIETKGFQELATVFEDKMDVHFSSFYSDESDEGDDDSGIGIPKVLAEAKFTKTGQSLKSTNDSDEPFIDEGCELVQIAVYYDEAVLLIDQDYWDLLDDFNRASLLSHEIIYAHKRRQGETNSISTRRFISHFLSDKGLIPRTGPKSLKKEDVLHCMTDQAYHGDEFILSFFVYQSKEDEVTFVLNTIGQEFPLFNVSAVVKERDLYDLVTPVSDLQSRYNFSFDMETTSLPFGYMDINNFYRGGNKDRSGFEVKIGYMKGQKEPIKQKIECFGFEYFEKMDVPAEEHIKTNFSEKTLTKKGVQKVSFSKNHHLVQSLEFGSDQSQFVKKVSVVEASTNKEICASVSTFSNWNVLWTKRIVEGSEDGSSYSTPYLRYEDSSSEITGDTSKVLNPEHSKNHYCVSALSEVKNNFEMYLVLQRIEHSSQTEFDTTGLMLGGERYDLNP